MPVEFIRKNEGAIKELTRRLDAIRRQKVKVGILENKTARKNELMTNSYIGYINENGSPENHIPARPFLRPAMLANQEFISSRLADGVEDEILGRKHGLRIALGEVGKTVRDSAKANIVNQVNFQSLSPKTLEYRAMEGFKGTKALIRTGQLLNSIHYKIDNFDDD
jgi:hypothetical protein